MSSLDAGPIFLQKAVEIPAQVTAGELSDVLAELGAEMLLATLDGLSRGTIHPIPQDDTLATYAPRITKELSDIDWKAKADRIHNQIRGLNPWPLAHTEFRGRRLQLYRSLPSPPPGSPASAPGTFLGSTREGILVQCGDGAALEVFEVQMEGKRRVSGREFANGARITEGERIFQ